MRGAKNKKHFWYVMVFTDEGTKFVTEVETEPHKYAHWDVDKKPLEMGQKDAEWLALGLSVNGNMAVVVSMPYELDNHIIDYGHGKFKWIPNEPAKEEPKENG